MKVRITLRFHFTLLRIAIIKKTTKTTNSGEAVERQTPSQIGGRNVN